MGWATLIRPYTTACQSKTKSRALLNTVEPLNKGPSEQRTLESTSCYSRTSEQGTLWGLRLSLVERSSISRKVPYQRLYCNPLVYYLTSEIGTTSLQGAKIVGPIVSLIHCMRICACATILLLVHNYVCGKNSDCHADRVIVLAKGNQSG